MEGEAGHEVAECAMRGVLKPVGEIASNGWPVMSEMVEGARLFVDTIRGLAPHVPFYLEQKFACGLVHPTHNGGTPDCVGADIPARCIYAVEYKFGHGFVDAFGNWQLVNQVLGFSEFLGIDGPHDEEWSVVMAVVQPRNYDYDGPVRIWRVRLSDLRPYAARLHAQAHLACSPAPPATVGPECEQCPGRGKCVALQRAASRIGEFTRYGTVQTHDMPSPHLGPELEAMRRAESLLKARISGLEMEMESRIASGDVRTGYVMESTGGREYWKVPPEKIVTLGQMYGVDLAKPVEMRTPRQTRELGIPVDGALVGRGPGTKKLIPLEKSKIHKAFTQE